MHSFSKMHCYFYRQKDQRCVILFLITGYNWIVMVFVPQLHNLAIPPLCIIVLRIRWHLRKSLTQFVSQDRDTIAKRKEKCTMNSFNRCIAEAPFISFLLTIITQVQKLSCMADSVEGLNNSSQTYLQSTYVTLIRTLASNSS